MFYILYVLCIVALSFHSNFLDFFYRKGVIPNDTFGRIFVKWGKIFSPAILLKNTKREDNYDIRNRIF